MEFADCSDHREGSLRRPDDSVGYGTPVIEPNPKSRSVSNSCAGVNRYDEPITPGLP